MPPCTPLKVTNPIPWMNQGKYRGHISPCHLSKKRTRSPGLTKVSTIGTHHHVTSQRNEPETPPSPWTNQSKYHRHIPPCKPLKETKPTPWISQSKYHGHIPLCYLSKKRTRPPGQTKVSTMGTYHHFTS